MRLIVSRTDASRASRAGPTGTHTLRADELPRGTITGRAHPSRPHHDPHTNLIHLYLSLTTATESVGVPVASLSLALLPTLFFGRASPPIQPNVPTEFYLRRVSPSTPLFAGRGKFSLFPGFSTPWRYRSQQTGKLHYIFFLAFREYIPTKHIIDTQNTEGGNNK